MSPLLIFWRTSITLLALAVFLLTGLIFCLHWPNGPGLFPSYATGIGALAGFAVVKSGVEHISNTVKAIRAPDAAPPLTEAK